MKNVIKLVVFAGMFSFVACGPTAQELAEQAKQDSIRVADSVAAVQYVADSIAAAELAQQAIADSIATADSLAALAKKK